MRQSGRLRDIYLGYRSFLRSAGGLPLGGRFVLLQEGSQMLERATAARIAGAAAMLVLGDEQDAKAAVREGACDFLVTSLDEALRILKNEIRRAAPVGVCLRASPAAALREMIERGVQPDLLDAREETLGARGARVVAWEHALRPGELAVAWSAGEGSARVMKALDQLALEALDSPDDEREFWLRNAPPTLGRILARWRWLPMRAVEFTRFAAAIAASPYAASVRLERDGTPVGPLPAD